MSYTAEGLTAPTGTVTVPTTEAGDVSAALSGQSQQAILGYDNSTSNWDNVQVGQSVTSGTRPVRNDGNTTLSGITITPPTGYSISNNTCGTSLAAQTACSFTVTFTPAVAQSYNGSVAIATSNGGSGSFSVAGTGVAQSASIGDLAFGSRASGTTTDLSATLSNTGIGALSVTVPNASNVSGTGFSFVSTNCPAKRRLCPLLGNPHQDLVDDEIQVQCRTALVGQDVQHDAAVALGEPNKLGVERLILGAQNSHVTSSQALNLGSAEAPTGSSSPPE